MDKLFETAARKKFRFNTERGAVTVEDLWDMPLQSKDGFNLDNTAVYLSNHLEERKSFVTPRAGADAETKAKLDLVLYVIETKMAEAEAKKTAAANAEKKDRILEILRQKQDDKLKDMSEDELKAQLGELT